MNSWLSQHQWQKSHIALLETRLLSVAFQIAPVAVRMLSLAPKYQPPSLWARKHVPCKSYLLNKIEWNEIINIPRCCGAPMQSGRVGNPPLLRSSSATGEWAEADDFKCHPWVFIQFSPSWVTAGHKLLPKNQ